MSFVVRQIAKRADGGDIIRTRTLAAAEITVGRGTECDIQLADLGVMLRHARLAQLSDGTVAIEATGGIPLEIDGKFVNRADLSVSDNPAINIASHRLTLSKGETPGAIAITAERVIPASDAADAAAETGIFSLRETMPSKRGLAWVLAGLVLIIGLAMPLFLSGGSKLPADMVAAAARPDGTSNAGRLTPALGGDDVKKTGYSADMVWTSGPLSDAHAGLANNCGACHTQPFVSVTDSACVACHTADAVPAHAGTDRMAKGRLPTEGVTAAFHKGFNLPEGRCASCHKEHEGPRGALMVAASFCTDCHTGLSGRLTDTKIANVPNWEEHPQFKATLVTTPSLTAPSFQRISLASKPQENSGLIYPHDIHQSATNAVGNMVQKQGLPAGGNGALACNYCHVADSDGVRFKPIEMEKNCGACHDLAFARDGGIVRTLPHGKPEQVAGIIRDFYLSQALNPRAGVQRLAFERRAPGKMAELEAADLRITSVGEARARGDNAIAQIFGANGKAGGLCSDCHIVNNTGAPNAAERFTIAPVTLADHYLPKGRFPHNQHKSYDKKTGDAACIACHKGVMASKVSTDVLLPPVGQCRDCHGSTNVATNVAATCNTCHGFHYGEGGQGGDFVSSPHRKPAKPATVAVRALPVRVGAAEPVASSSRKAGV